MEFRMYRQMLFLLTFVHRTFAENTTNITFGDEERTAVKCVLGDHGSRDDLQLFTVQEENHYHIPPIREQNCSEAYPECFPGMLQQVKHVRELIWQVKDQKRYSYIVLGTSTHLSFITLIKHFYKNVTAMMESEVTEEFHGVCYSFNLTMWKKNIQWHDGHYSDFHKQEAYFKELYNWHEIYFPIAFPLFLIIGLLGNFIVLLILARHHVMWTTANKVVLNLAVADILFLVFNVGIFYVSFHLPLMLNGTMCYVKVYAENLATAASVYSTALLSFFRYMAVAAITGGCPRRIMRFRRTVPVMLVFIWILAAIAAVPSVIHVNQRAFDCNSHAQKEGGTVGLHRVKYMFELESTVGPHVTRLITNCVLPLVVIVVFSIATSQMLRQSAKDIPGEDPGLGRARQEREKGAYIILALVTVFIVTHVPIHVSHFMVLYRETLQLSFAQCLLLLYVPRILFPLNSCLNPTALFIAGRSFRKYFKHYLLCRCFRKLPLSYQSCRTQTQTMSSFRNSSM